MKKVKVFYKEESASFPGKYIIKVDTEKFHIQSAKGSLHIIQARLFGLMYSEYLRMCRDFFEADIVGKNELYPVAYFKSIEKLEILIDNLNARATLVLWEREHPDFDDHANYVKQMNPRFYSEVTNHADND